MLLVRIYIALSSRIEEISLRVHCSMAGKVPPSALIATISQDIGLQICMTSCTIFEGRDRRAWCLVVAILTLSPQKLDISVKIEAS